MRTVNSLTTVYKLLYLSESPCVSPIALANFSASLIALLYNKSLTDVMRDYCLNYNRMHGIPYEKNISRNGVRKFLFRSLWLTAPSRYVIYR